MTEQPKSKKSAKEVNASLKAALEKTTVRVEPVYTGNRPNHAGRDFRGVDLTSHEGAENLVFDGRVFNTRLQTAILDGANFQGAKLDGQNCQGASWKGADLSGASLKGCDLRWCNFHGAIVDEFTDFTDADLRESVGLG